MGIKCINVSVQCIKIKESQYFYVGNSDFVFFFIVYGVGVKLVVLIIKWYDLWDGNVLVLSGEGKLGVQI